MLISIIRRYACIANAGRAISHHSGRLGATELQAPRKLMQIDLCVWKALRAATLSARNPYQLLDRPFARRNETGVRGALVLQDSRLPQGGAVPLVLLHGGGSTIETSFGKLLPLLSKERQVIAFEQQGHGHTADVDRPFSFEQSAEDAVAFALSPESREGGLVRLRQRRPHRAASRDLISRGGAWPDPAIDHVQEIDPSCVTSSYFASEKGGPAHAAAATGAAGLAAVVFSLGDADLFELGPEFLVGEGGLGHSTRVSRGAGLAIRCSVSSGRYRHLAGKLPARGASALHPATQDYFPGLGRQATAPSARRVAGSFECQRPQCQREQICEAIPAARAPAGCVSEFG